MLVTVSVQEDYSTARRYVLNLQDLNWYEAYDYCQDTGGNLAKIYDIATIPDLNISQSLTGYVSMKARYDQVKPCILSI